MAEVKTHKPNAAVEVKLKNVNSLNRASVRPCFIIILTSKLALSLDISRHRTLAIYTLKR